MNEDILKPETIGQLNPEVLVPAYDRNVVKCGIVHLGVGNFHRAHQAVYCDDAIAAGNSDWAICGVCLRTAGTRDQLAPQDGLYTVCERDGDSHRLRVIGSITNVIFAPENPSLVLDRLTNKDTRIVTLTITEKGYVWPARARPNWDPETFSDQASPALLYLVEALWRRWSDGTDYFTILSCDNLSSNGKTVKEAVLRLAHDRDPTFATTLEGKLACPSSMVDRIVPRPTNKERIDINSLIGLNDAASIITEPFSQWVIEDNFPTGRPSWENHGVNFVDDIEPYEDIKLRLLNGAHTFIALFGQLTDMKLVSDVMAVEEIDRFLDLFWSQSSKTLNVEDDLSAYRDALKRRFANGALQHQTAQVVIDTSQKIPQRILAPLIELDRAGEDARAHCFVVALWVSFLLGKSEGGSEITIEDPLADDLQNSAASREIKRFAEEASVFPFDFKNNFNLLLTVAQQYAQITSMGARGALSNLVQQLKQGDAA